MNQPAARDIDHALTLPNDQALSQFQAWAMAGVPEAQLVLGQMLLDGRGAAADAQAGFRWFLKAARAGHPMAMNMVGRCYENGWGVSADPAIATTWFRGAADKGLDWGMYNYATSLALGRGVAEDRQAALGWLRRATALGHAKSMNLLGGFYEDGWGVEADLAQARALYQQAAEGGDFRGWFNLGRFQRAEGDAQGAEVSFRRARQDATPAFRASMDDYLSGVGAGLRDGT
ncbi:tetratricopeptide repeat protein [Brevundimonas diminuta]|uniref:tetratricopeptide repeat protein n=1 Tax=Brevundimonas diminuta TaxID=293 RepID=UPI00320A71D7